LRNQNRRKKRLDVELRVPSWSGPILSKKRRMSRKKKRSVQLEALRLNQSKLRRRKNEVEAKRPRKKNPLRLKERSRTRKISKQWPKEAKEKLVEVPKLPLSIAAHDQFTKEMLII